MMYLNSEITSSDRGWYLDLPTYKACGLHTGPLESLCVSWCVCVHACLNHKSGYTYVSVRVQLLGTYIVSLGMYV